MSTSPPLVVLVLGGVAERWDCPERESPLAQAATPALDRLAREGRVFGVRLIGRPGQACTAAPMLALLGIDPDKFETARASYLGVLAGAQLAPEECFVSADFLALFRDMVADVEPGPLRAAEIEVLLKSADAAIQRAGFRLKPGGESHHLAVAPRASVDPGVPAPEMLLGRSIADAEPAVDQHAFAHRLARQVLDGHEVNEVRRDLGANGADTVWLWGPGGPARLPPVEADDPIAAFGSDLIWRGVCKAAGVPIKSPAARKPAQLVRGVQQALGSAGLCFLYARRGVHDALQRDAAERTAGVAEIDKHLVGPVAELAAEHGARLLVVPDTARDTAGGHALPDAVPALLWGKGIHALSRRGFTEAGAAAAGEPLSPGHGLVPYVQRF
ncbi:MAG: hypothetical protein ACYSUN_02320 [Planctomycetota bacterium]